MEYPLLTDAKLLMLKQLALHGAKPTGNDLQSIMTSFFNLKHKFIKNQLRKVVMSRGLQAKASVLNLDAILKTVAQHFTDGSDVNPYLSKGIIRAGKHDFLLNDWEIHHLHLNDKKDKPADYFKQRSSQLLFAHITPETAYFIDIRHHNENLVFAQRDLLRIVRDNWPDLNRKFLVQEEPMEVFPKHDEQGIHNLRKGSFLFFTQVDDHAYMPGLGSAVSGFSMKAGMEMNAFCAQLYKIHSYISENEQKLKDRLAAKSGLDLKSVNFVLALKDWTFYVYEENSRHLLNFELSGYTPAFGDAEISRPTN